MIKALLIKSSKKRNQKLFLIKRNLHTLYSIKRDKLKKLGFEYKHKDLENELKLPLTKR